MANNSKKTVSYLWLYNWTGSSSERYSFAVRLTALPEGSDAILLFEPMQKTGKFEDHIECGEDSENLIHSTRIVRRIYWELFCFEHLDYSRKANL